MSGREREGLQVSLIDPRRVGFDPIESWPASQHRRAVNAYAERQARDHADECARWERAAETFERAATPGPTADAPCLWVCWACGVWFPSWIHMGASGRPARACWCPRCGEFAEYAVRGWPSAEAATALGGPDQQPPPDQTGGDRRKRPA